MLDWLKELWCGWTHGGGTIKRDPSDRINWQCRKCGRWSSPVPAADEAAMVDANIHHTRGLRGTTTED